VLTVTDEKMFSLRGRALNCMSRMALAVGGEEFAPYLQVSMQVSHSQSRGHGHRGVDFVHPSNGCDKLPYCGLVRLGGQGER
jgi:hypothetical protein